MTPSFDFETLCKGNTVCGMERLFDVPSKAFEKLTQLCFQFRRNTMHNILLSELIYDS